MGTASPGQSSSTREKAVPGSGLSVVSEPQDATASKRPTGRRELASVRHTAATVPIGDTMSRSAGSSGRVGCHTPQQGWGHAR